MYLHACRSIAYHYRGRLAWLYVHLSFVFVVCDWKKVSSLTLLSLIVVGSEDLDNLEIETPNQKDSFASIADKRLECQIFLHLFVGLSLYLA